MSLWHCIQQASQAGLTTQARAQATQDAYRELYEKYVRAGHSQSSARTMAAEDVTEAFRRDTAIKRHQRLADLAVMRKNYADVMAADDVGDALKQPLEYRDDRALQVDSVRSMQVALEQRFQGQMARFFTEIHRNIVGQVKKQALLKDVIRELHGEATGTQVAADMAAAIRKTFEDARLMFNEAGGHIEKLADWGLPHSHDATKVGRVSAKQWARDIHDMLNWDRITDRMTGRPLSQSTMADRLAFLEKAHKGIVSSGLTKAEPRYGPTSGTGRLSDDGSYQRVLHFKDAESWMAYNETYGAADPFSSITQHFKRMSRDIALMRVLGTNPRFGLEHRYQVAMKKLVDAGRIEEARNLKAPMDHARAMLMQLTGESQVPVNEFVANMFSGTRQVMTGAYLGSAILSSSSDVAALRLAARSVGGSPNNVVSQHVKLMAGTDAQTAAQLGYIADTLTDAGNTLSRFLGDVPSNEILERLTSFTMRAQGLSHWTDMGRVAFRMEMSALFAREADKPLSEVTEPLRLLMDRRGITPQMWDAYRDPASRFTAPNGSKFIAPTWWLSHTNLSVEEADFIAMRFASMIEEQVEMAMPTLSISGRALIQGQARPGTLQGELMLSAMMFKSFALSFWINQIARISAKKTIAGKAGYAAQLVGMFTLMGAVSIQLKEMSKGRDPRPMDTWAFWGAALAQGGGLGILGDIALAGASPYGGGLGEYASGPVVGLMGDAIRLGAGVGEGLIEGDYRGAARDVADFALGLTPASSLWQTRAAFDRLVSDQLLSFLDPDAEREMYLAAQKRQNAYGNAEWWGTGDALPSRAPNLGAALGDLR